MERTAGRIWTRVFAVAFASHFLHGLSYNLYLHLPGYLHRTGAEEGLIGLIFGLTAAVGILTRPSIGRIIDRRGPRFVVVGGGIVSTIVCAGYLAARGVGPLLVLLRTFHGVGEAMLFASLFVYAAGIVPAEQRIRGIAVFGVSGMLPLGVGGAVGDLLLGLDVPFGEQGAYAVLFGVSAVLSLAGLLLSLFLPEQRTAGGVPSRGVRAAALERPLLPLWAAGLGFAMAITAGSTFMKTYVVSTGIGSAGLFFGVYSVAAVLLRLFFGTLPERLGPTRVLLAALASVATGYALLAALGVSAAVAAAGLLCGLGHGFAFPILAGLVVGRSRASERGAAMSVFTALFDAGTLLGAPVLGQVVEVAGYPTMFAVASGLAAFGAVSFVVLDSRVPPSVV